MLQRPSGERDQVIRHDPIVVAFFLSPGFEMLTFTLAVEVLRLANRVVGRDIFQWRIASQSGEPVVASCGVSVASGLTLAQERKHLFGINRPNMAIVCSDESDKSCNRKVTEAWLRECRHRKIATAALGSGISVLARAGLLNNRRCAVHWESQPGFDAKFMSVQTTTNVYEIDDEVWTCAGGTASFDMMIHFVERHCGELTAVKICDHAIVERVRTGDERQRLPMLRRHGTINAVVRKLVETMQQHLAVPVSIESLATSVGLSRRQVERLFRTELDCSPIGYYRELRLARARLLLSHSAMPVVDVAISCGFTSASHFSKCFRAFHSIGPNEARKRRPTGMLGRCRLEGEKLFLERDQTAVG